MNRRTAGVTSLVVRTMLLVASGAMTACGPITSSSVIVDAAAEVAAARTAGAEESAPFEFKSAEAFLRKARQEQGDAEFELSVALARRSLACARSAVARMEGRAPPTEPGAEPMPDFRCRPTRTASVAIGRRASPGLRAVEPRDPAPAKAVSRPAAPTKAVSRPAPRTKPVSAPRPAAKPRRPSPDTPPLEPAPFEDEPDPGDDSLEPPKELPPKEP